MGDIEPLLPEVAITTIDAALQALLHDNSSTSRYANAISKLLVARSDCAMGYSPKLPVWLSEDALHTLLQIVANEGEGSDAAAKTLEDLARLSIPGQALDEEAFTSASAAFATLSAHFKLVLSHLDQLPTTASACILRSAAASQQLGAALATRESVPAETLTRYLETQAAVKGSSLLSARLGQDIVDTAIASKDARVLGALSTIGKRFELVSSALAKYVDALPRDAHSAADVLFVDQLVGGDAALAPHLDKLINNSFAGLVRRFVEDEEDQPSTIALVQALCTLRPLIRQNV